MSDIRFNSVHFKTDPDGVVRQFVIEKQELITIYEVIVPESNEVRETRKRWLEGLKQSTKQ